MSETTTPLVFREKIKQQTVDYDYVNIETEHHDDDNAPISRTLSVEATENWEKQLLADPKVPHHTPLMTPRMVPVSNTNTQSTEPPRPLRAPLQPRPFHHHAKDRDPPRHPDLQHQNSFRGVSNHEPTLLRPMLALRGHQRLPRRDHEEAQPRELRAESSVPVLLG